MKEAKIKVKVKTKKAEDTIKEYQNFLWTLYDRQEKGGKTILYFKRGATELVDRKARKNVKNYEKAYYEIARKRTPVAFIILALLAIACFATTFALDLQDLFNIVLYSIGAIFGVFALIALIFYLIIILKKKSLKEKCVEKAQYYNAKLDGELDPGQQINEITPLDDEQNQD